MKKLCFNIFLALIISMYCSSMAFSDSLVDSLYIMLIDAEGDSNKVDLLNKISREYRIDDPLKAFDFNRRAFELARELDYIPGLARAYDLLGTIYRYQADYAASLENYFKAIDLYEQLNDSDYLANVYNYIGHNYIDMEEMEKALFYSNIAVELFRQLDDYKGLAFMYNNLGIIYRNIIEKDTALWYYEKAYEMNKKIHRETGMGYTTVNIGNIYLSKGNYVKAKSFYFKSFNYFKEANNLAGLTLAYYNIGNFYFYTSELDSAEFYFLEGNRIASEHSLLENKQSCLLGLKRLFKERKDFTSFAYYTDEYINIQDSLLKENVNKKILDLEKKVAFERAIKDKEIELIEKSKQLKIESLQKYILVVILLSSIVIAWFIINRKKTKIKHFDEQIKSQSSELVNLAMYILQKNELIHEFRKELLRVQKRLKVEENKNAVNEVINSLVFKIAVSKDIEEFRDKLRDMTQLFYKELENKIPGLTLKEKQVVTLLRLGLSSKQIAVILDVFSESVDTYRYRLRKKIGLSKDKTITAFLNNI